MLRRVTVSFKSQTNVTIKTQAQKCPIIHQKFGSQSETLRLFTKVLSLTESPQEIITKLLKHLKDRLSRFCTAHTLNRQISFTVKLLHHMGWYHPPQYRLFLRNIWERKKEKCYFLLDLRTCKGKSTICSLFPLFFMNIVMIIVSRCGRIRSVVTMAMLYY